MFDQPQSQSARPSSRMMEKAKATAIVIGALATAATALYGAIRRPEEKLQKLTYEAIEAKTKEHDEGLKNLTMQVTGITSYLQAMKDYRLLTELPVAIPAATTPGTRRSGASTPPAASVVLRVIPMASSSMAAPEPPAPAPAAPAILKSLPKFDSLSAEAAGR